HGSSRTRISAAGAGHRDIGDSAHHSWLWPGARDCLPRHVRLLPLGFQRVFDPPALVGFALKCLAFSLAVAVLPVAAGTEATRQMRSAPVAVMGGMVRLFFALGLIEVLALAVKYV